MGGGHVDQSTGGVREACYVFDGGNQTPTQRKGHEMSTHRPRWTIHTHLHTPFLVYPANLPHCFYLSSPSSLFGTRVGITLATRSSPPSLSPLSFYDYTWVHLIVVFHLFALEFQFRSWETLLWSDVIRFKSSCLLSCLPPSSFVIRLAGWVTWAIRHQSWLFRSSSSSPFSSFPFRFPSYFLFFSFCHSLVRCKAHVTRYLAISANL
ncbi:hypothetical protein B0T19DRAFT_409995 [Cercophora scortea]|uniref:Uncharacterized protein n=1 Tax=Cercophora scortea TaxID=314031 RepID=A0AAE0MLJ4_9PEZI|nr:hypothetical protein B0T19DRAFT_409995 [Cercophora scortea]